MEHTPADARLERIEAALENLPEVMRSMHAAAKREIVEELTEVMRSMQTELLRGFAAFAECQAARMKKLETNHAALDESATVRLMPRTFCAPVNWGYGLALRLGKGFVLCQTSLG